MSLDPLIGEIIMFAGNFAPQGWAFCYGQTLPIQQYTALFSIIGTTYGGDGIQTFALPDLRGRMPIGGGNGPGLTPRDLGHASGSETVQLSVAQLPAHFHSLAGYTTAVGNSTSPNLPAASAAEDAIYSTGAPTHATNSGITGSSQPVSIMPPFCGVNFIIALEGVYPSRS